jgi:hypothetical protein
VTLVRVAPCFQNGILNAVFSGEKEHFVFKWQKAEEQKGTKLPYQTLLQ